MIRLEASFRQRASALAPTPAQRSAAARSHAFLRDSLNRGRYGHRILADYLSGSYARHTAIRPLDDVDLVFEIDPTQFSRSFFGEMFGMLPKPETVIESFARAVRYRYPDSSVRAQRCSVGLLMSDLRIDVVPAVQYDQHPGYLLIGDRTNGTWLPTGPQVHSDVATAVNEACGGLLKPIVRLLKGWNGSLPSTASLKSFAIETMALHLFDRHPCASLSEGVYVFMEMLCQLGGAGTTLEWTPDLPITFSRWGPTLPDVAATGGNLLAGVDHDRLAKLTAAAHVTRGAFHKAEQARSDDRAWEYLEHRFRGGLKRV